MEEKNHYRKVFKSEHLGVADLEEFIEEGKSLVFTIDHVKQEYGATVAGKKGNFNIAYFKDKIKPLVLNATNSKTMKKLSGGSAFVEDWNDILVQLYIDPSAKMKGEVVGGVRIKPDSPKKVKPKLEPGTAWWKNAVEAYKRDKKFTEIEKHAIVTKENKELIKKEAEDVD